MNVLVAAHQPAMDCVLVVVQIHVMPCAMAPVKECALLLVVELVLVPAILHVNLLQNSDRK